MNILGQADSCGALQGPGEYCLVFVFFSESFSIRVKLMQYIVSLICLDIVGLINVWLLLFVFDINVLHSQFIMSQIHYNETIPVYLWVLWLRLSTVIILTIFHEKQQNHINKFA